MKVKEWIKRDYVQSFLICFMIACLALLPLVIKGKGFFVLTNDFNDQQIPFTIGLHKDLLDGGFSGFSWDVDLGTSTIQAYSFYELGGPFFWLSMLFPANAFPYIVAWLFMLKFAFAGVTSCLYLRRFVNESKWAVLGSVLYAFSGFSIINMLFYHFHDAIVFFPLMLIGLEIFKEKNDCRFFVFTIFLNCFINYFFFIGEVVFLVIYYLFRFASKDIKTLVTDIFKCIGCGVLGVAMAAFMFIPNILFVTGNPRTGQFSGFLSMLKTTLPDYMYILKSLLLPAETMTSVSVISEQNFSSHGMYMPLFGLVLVLAYIIKKRDWLSRIIIFCTVASFIPLLSDLFYMYSAAQMRWWYMFSLMVALASVMMLEEPDVKATKTGTIIYIAAIAVFVIAINILNVLNAQGNTWILRGVRFYTLVALAIIGALVTNYIVSKQNISYKNVFTNVCIVSLGLMLCTTYIYKTCDWMGYQAYKQKYDIAKELELPSQQYRLNNTMNLISMEAHVAGFTNQTSTNANSIIEFEDLFDYYHNVAGMPKNDIPGLAALLGGKYYLMYEESAGTVVDEYDTDLSKAYLMETGACPIGFAVDSYITLDELKSLPVNQRAIALMDSAVLAEDDITEEIKTDLVETKAGDINFEKSIDEYVVDNTYGSVLGFTKDGHGMKCVTGYDKDTYVYFSVPYDEGWTATIDGIKTDIIKSGGMMLIKVPSGNHNIEFSYCTPGLKLGLIVAAIGWISFIGMIIIFKKKKGQ
ncbi:YfhO family protein [Pseudobutyrivibrio xylanivorans]|uniref:Membrane protein YfhO n=1 Tax=Pseudobutyrivibrio xylanivorans DSM 14809 TaxID=1123012 RepID=A0A1M6JRL3_PSEXY|nr:YfhO family protein [Pseudobutyrivibrio xylanivorans]SHJ49367.1 membrane protein YfhO [Pseudobutyrivibrio xylanivorans DSM 14809]